jgi:hypothetical protein
MMVAANGAIMLIPAIGSSFGLIVASKKLRPTGKLACHAAKFEDDYRARVLRRDCITAEARCSGNGRPAALTGV